MRYDTKLKLQGVAKRLAVAVYDPLSGKIATAQVEIPGEFQELDAGKDSKDLKESKDDNG